MSIERKRGMAPVPALASFPEFPKLESNGRGSVDIAQANEAIAAWCLDVTKLLTEEFDAIRQRVEALEAK